MKFVILLLFVNITVFAQINKDSNIEKKPVENIKTNSSDTIDEKNVYKLLYEETKQTNDRLVSTVLWALGGVITLALLLIGYNVLYNFKINKDQITNINERIDNKIDEIRNEDLTSLNSKLDENQKEYDRKLEQNELNIKDELTSSIASLTKTYETQNNAYKDSFELQIKTIVQSQEDRTKNSNEALNLLKDKIVNVESKLNSSIENLKSDHDREINFLKFQTNLSEGQLWKVKDIHMNSLRCYIDALEVENQMVAKSSICGNLINSTLDLIKESLPESMKLELISLLKSSNKLESGLVNEIMGKINNLNKT